MELVMREHFLIHSIGMQEVQSPRYMSRCLLRTVAAAALLTGVSDAVLAQDAGSLLREQQRRQELQQPERLPKPEESRDKPAPLASPETGETLLVKELRFTGKTELLPPAERERFAVALQYKRVGMASLQALADEVTAALQKQGRLLARAILPPQDITAGVVTLDIAEGTLERIDIEPGKNVRIRKDLLQAIGQSKILPDGVSKQALEEALLRMNDLPGVTARARLAPGATPNTSRVVVDVDQAPILSASAWGDNYGSAGTGRAQANVLVTLADLSGLGDQTRLTGSFSEGQKFAQAEVSVPLGASGVTAHASYGDLAYRNIDGLGLQAGLEGVAHYAEAGLEYSLVRSRELNLRLSTSLNGKELVDDAITGRLQDKRSRSVNLAVTGEMRDALGGGGLTSWSLGWTWGDLDLSRVPAALAADAAGLKTQGSYQRLNASLSRLQALPGEFALFTRVYGQWASKNLDSSEDFSLGGPYGVRGWAVGEGRGDMGLLGTVELRYDVPVQAPWRQVQLSAFVDGGRVRVNKNPNGVPLLTACGCNVYSLSSAGLGLRLIREDLSLSTFYATGIGDNPGRSSESSGHADGSTSRRQFWLQGAIRF
jgi:hemolysin activation/secretion protein